MSPIKEANKKACSDSRRELARHSVDCSEVQITASHGIIHLSGKIRPVRGREDTFAADVLNLVKALRKKPGIRDVISNLSGI